jgi:CheY-like chemotaxis protein
MEQIDLERPESWRVLVVDDDDDNLEIAKDTFTMFGSTVRTAEDGQAAILTLNTFQPTFILLDLSMPKMDGWQTLDAIRQSPTWAHIPVIALTAHAMVGDRERVMEAGFDGYIGKPFHISTVLDEVRFCLAKFVAARSK